MMGAGKSAVGRQLAASTGREFVDADALLQERFGRTISQFFAIYGEDAFREQETSLLRLLEPGPYVLSTGGGVVTRPENWAEIARLGQSVYLEASLETLIGRLSRSKGKRPLLSGPNWRGDVKTLLEVRSPLYRQADFTFRVDHLSLMEVVSGVLQVLEPN
jgi:shikimate kinase